MSNVNPGGGLTGTNSAITSIAANTGTDNRMVMKLELSGVDTLVSLWVNSETEDAPDATFTLSNTALSLTGLTFRSWFGQSGGQGQERTAIWDDLVVATTFGEAAMIPEPSSAILLGLGALGLCRRRRP